jgi:hypothetical protein
MAEQVGAGLTRFDLASRAVGQALGQMGPADQFGLWVFPGAGGRGYRKVVGVAAGDQRHREATGTALQAVRPGGGTPLYDTIVAGLRAVARPAGGIEPRALVVLTDGQDTSSGISAVAARQSVRDLARTTGARLYVVATGEASCGGPQGLRNLAAAGLGGCFDADPDQLPDAIAQLFDVLWKGQ